ncbi:hypothetical protein BM477_00590 [Boudabousia marimammalium]|uniref:GmrSD restriction endonucleases C-terminal domain-containing protein n=1 Tax=Boudabousia marimammalium TaxID=156892 RepID=A0A1Q5PSZ5_9ACTO|nr:hypothetical protein BM477_00590 [Boudabousia marimammalium]
MRNLLTLIILVAVTGYLLIPGLGPDLLDLGRSSSGTGGSPSSSSQINPEIVTALGKVRVREGEYESTRRYEREDFGEAWADEDHNGCNTRNDILSRDLSDVEYTSPRKPCKVLSGRLAEPYTGESVEFVKGPNTSPLVQIDHVVALGDAWRSGAQKWDLAKRQRFANDPLNLLAVDGKANYEKGSASADQWLPANRHYHCRYVARQLAVKAKWDLSMTRAEKQAINSVIATCPTVKLPQDFGEIKP